MRLTPIAGWFAVTLSVLGAAGCSGDSVAGPPPPPPRPVPVATVSVTPARDTLVVGGTRQLAAAVKDANLNDLVRTVTWASADANVATVSDAGLATAVGVGTVTISATAGGVTGQATLAVRSGGVATPAGGTIKVSRDSLQLVIPPGAVTQATSLVVEPYATPPQDARLMAGSAYKFGPDGTTFAVPVVIKIRVDTSKAGNHNVAALRLYQITDAGYLPVQGSGLDPLDGTVTGAVAHFSQYAVLGQAPVARVVVTPAQPTLPLGATVSLSAVAEDATGAALTGLTTGWSSAAPATASVSPTGVVTGAGLGATIVSASVAGVLGSTSVTVVVPPPAAVAAASPVTQVGITGKPVASPPSVMVTDYAGKPVVGASVTFSVTGGGGTIAAAAQVTGANGVATAGAWILGSSTGPNTASASVAGAGISGNPVAFGATAVAPVVPTVVTAVGPISQVGTAGKAPGTLPSVLVKDQQGKPAAGVPVVFAITAGQGSVTGATQSTDQNGIATLGSWILDAKVGVNSLTATVGAQGVAGNPVTFTATGQAGPAVKVAAATAVPQSGTVGSQVVPPPAVLAQDAYDNPVAGVTVTFAVAAGGGSVTGATQVTSAQGVATVGSWILGTTTGPNTLTATASGAALAGNSVTFSVTGQPPAPAAISAQSPVTQTASAGAAVPVPPSVKVVDAAGNPVANVAIAWAVTAGGGAVAGAAVTTNAAGVASVGTWTLGATAGPNSLTATAAGNGIGGNPVMFQATGAPNATPATITIDQPTGVVPPNQTLRLRATVKDAAGQPIAGALVQWTSSNPAVASVDPTGIVSGLVQGSAQVSATSGSITGTSVITVPSRFRWIDLGQSCGIGAGGAVNGLLPFCISRLRGYQPSLGAGAYQTWPPTALPVPVDGATAISSDGFDACAVNGGGAGYCWGDHFKPDGTMLYYSAPNTPFPNHVPVAPAGGVSWKSLGLGGGFACGLSLSADAYCWGDNYSYTVGDPNYQVRGADAPHAVSGGLKFSSLSVSPQRSGSTVGTFVCGVAVGGTVYCWGSMFVGQTMADPAMAPTPIAIAQTFDSVVAGDRHACAWRVGGQLYCWGSVIPASISPYGGEIGPNGPTRTPVLVPGAVNVRSVQAGTGWTCVLEMSGTVRCMGRNDVGQLGIGATDANSHAALQQVPGLPPIAKFGSGKGFPCVVSTTGDGYCWGGGGWLTGNEWEIPPRHNAPGNRWITSPVLIRPVYAATPSVTLQATGGAIVSLGNGTSGPAVDTLSVGGTVRVVADPASCNGRVFGGGFSDLTGAGPGLLQDNSYRLLPEQVYGSGACSGVRTLWRAGTWYLTLPVMPAGAYGTVRIVVR